MSTPWALAAATEAELPSVLAIEHRCFPDPWPATAFAAELQYDWAWFQVAGPAAPGARPARPERIDAFAICWMLPGDMHVLNLAVVPERRRHGLGRYLVARAMEVFAARGGGSVGLEVRPSNLAAQRLYTSLGFEITGRRLRYYRNGEDAVLMVRPVDTALGDLDGLARRRRRA